MSVTVLLFLLLLLWLLTCKQTRTLVDTVGLRLVLVTLSVSAKVVECEEH